MKKLICVLLLSVIALTGNLLEAQTNVSGIITTNTAWTVTGSPYIVTGNTLLDSGYTLTIEPGVVVKFNSGLSIQIDGTLIAQGTSDHKITFTSNTADTAGAWGYIYFSSASTDAVFENNIYGNYLSGSILEHCIIQYAGGISVTDNGALRLENAAPFINYCSITNNSASGIRAFDMSGSFKISNSVITNNVSSANGGGIYIYNDQWDGIAATSLISGNTISNNNTTYPSSTSEGGGIYMAAGNYKTIIVSNNIINDNTANNGGGICNAYHGTAYIYNNVLINNEASNNIANVDAGGAAIYNKASSFIYNNIISDNASLSNGGGIINFQGNSSVVNNNIIVDNTATITGGGIYCWDAASPMILNNHIVRNTANDDAGVYLLNGYNDGLKFNSIVDNKNTDYNNIYNRTIYITSDHPEINNNNIFNNSAFIELYNDNAQGSANVVSTNNWWGTVNDADIQAKIYDWFDDNSLGIVNYSPFLTAPDTAAPLSPPANAIKTDLGGGQVQITWLPNPEPDAAGYHIYYGGFNGFSFTHSVDVGNNISYISSALSITDVIAVTAYDNMYSPANENDSTIVNDNMINGNESWFTFAVDTSAISNITQDDNEMSISYSLVQNYPNPFNSTSVIKYSIPISSQVILKIFNALGEELETLVNEVKRAGIYEIDWNAVNLPSGVYFYRLQAGGFASTRKMILLK